MSDYLDARQEERDRRYEQRKQQMQTTSPPRPPKKFPAPTRPARPKPTKRIITAQERQLSATADIANRVGVSWPRVEAVAAALGRPTLRAAAPRDGGRSADHPDPVAGIAFDHEPYDELRDAIHAWLEQGKWIEQRSIAYLRDHPVDAAAKVDSLKSLCHEPGCDFDAVRRGLCWHHYERQLDAERGADQDHHTLATVVLASSASSSPLTPASSTASVWCSTCGEDYAVPAGGNPVAWLAEHRRERHEG